VWLSHQMPTIEICNNTLHGEELTETLVQSEAMIVGAATNAWGEQG